MLNQSLTIYRSLLLFLALSVGCATTAPYQAMSDAKQALVAAKSTMDKRKTVSDSDKTNYYQAKQALTAAEAALNQGRHGQARQLIEQSQGYSQTILKRLREQPNNSPSTYQFRY